MGFFQKKSQISKYSIGKLRMIEASLYSQIEFLEYQIYDREKNIEHILQSQTSFVSEFEIISTGKILNQHIQSKKELIRRLRLLEDKLEIISKLIRIKEETILLPGINETFFDLRETEEMVNIIEKNELQNELDEIKTKTILKNIDQNREDLEAILSILKSTSFDRENLVFVKNRIGSPPILKIDLT